MNNAVYGETLENLRNGVDVNSVNDEKCYFIWTSKRSYKAQKNWHLFDSDSQNEGYSNT